MAAGSAQATARLPGSAIVPEGLKRPPRILVADANDDVRKLLHHHLRRAGTEARVVGTAHEALSWAEAQSAIDLVMMGLNLPDRPGLGLLDELRATGKVGSLIVLSNGPDPKLEIQALNGGAFNFVDRTSSFDVIRQAIRDALQKHGLREEVETLREQLRTQGGGPATPIIGDSPAMARVMKLVRKVAGSDITVLIQGQSGSGKELIAQAVHDLGPNPGQPFVALNCAAIPENLLESELFGHEKGSFTGATARRIGKFEEAHEGTLFLDEIGELSAQLQAKLLRVLQTGEIQPIGGQLKRVKVRVISATHQHLPAMVERGLFRHDLFYRLAVFPIEVPSLAERPGDIPLLAEHFLHIFANQEQKPVRGIAPDVMEKLKTLPWHGNVRELENMIYRAVVLAESDMLRREDFPALLAGPPVAMGRNLPPAPPHLGGNLPHWTTHPARDPLEPAPFNPLAVPGPPAIANMSPLDELPQRTHTQASAQAPAPGAAVGSLEAAEIAAIRNALDGNGGNMSRTAIQLGIGRATLYRKARKYGLT